MRNIVSHTNQVINAVREKTGSVILFYSCGKDSMAMLDMIYPRFERVICVFMYFVQGLKHIEKYINYSKLKYPNVEFIQVPHWNLTWIIREGVYCAPNPHIKTLTIKDVFENIKNQTGLEYGFFGMKQSDSLNRHMTLKNYELEAISKSGMVYPLSKWSNKEVTNYIQINRLPKPICYTNKKKSQGIGFDIDVFLYLRQNYPEDLQMILKQFPMSERLLFEYDLKNPKDGN